jgi:hypothetical protein
MCISNLKNFSGAYTPDPYNKGEGRGGEEKGGKGTEGRGMG